MAKNYTFTLNNYTEDEYDKICLQCESRAKYWIIGRERGASGTPHLQGYFSLRDRCRIKALRDNFSDRAHYEVAKGTRRQNRVYCSKDGEFREGGDVPKSPIKRKSRDELGREFRMAVDGGVRRVIDFADENPGVWAFSGFSLLRNSLLIKEPIERPEICVDWLWGPPGVGKSRLAHEKLKDAYIKDPRTKWWNGYMLERDVIIDDMGPNGIDINHLLRWFDRYKCIVETKGGMVPLYAVNFIVTSNFHPSDIYKDKEGVNHVQDEALLRRLNIIKME